MTFPATLPGPALARRAVTGLALAMLAVSGTGAVTIAATAAAGHATVSTHASTTATSKTTSSNDNGTTTAFGQQVKSQVATCKAGLQAGQHGIGSCVSTWVQAHNPSNSRPSAPQNSAPRH